MMIPVPAARTRSGMPAAQRGPAEACRRSPALFTMTALLLFAVLAAADESRAPKIVLPELKHDFGTVPAGHRAEHVFEIRNGGDAVLEIRKVQPT